MELEKKMAIIEQRVARLEQEQQEIQVQIRHHDSLLNDLDKRLDMGFTETNSNINAKTQGLQRQLTEQNDRAERRFQIFKNIFWKVIIPLIVAVTATLIAMELT